MFKCVACECVRRCVRMSARAHPNACVSMRPLIESVCAHERVCERVQMRVSVIVCARKRTCMCMRACLCVSESVCACVCDRVRVIVRKGVSVSLSVRKHACVRE